MSNVLNGNSNNSNHTQISNGMIQKEEKNDVIKEKTFAKWSNKENGKKTTIVINNLDADQVPRIVVTAKMINNNLYCLVKFRERTDGYIHPDAYVPSLILADKYPSILIDFYESKIKFI
jgi:hypothetical protein